MFVVAVAEVAAVAVEVVAALGEVACMFVESLLREVLQLCVVRRGIPERVLSESCQAEVLGA